MSSLRQSDSTPCPLCAAGSRGFLFFVESCEIVRCNACGLLSTEPTLDGPALSALYAGEFYDPQARRFRLGFVDRLMRYFRVVRARSLHHQLGGRPGRILDVGCGRGFTLAALQAMGHEVHGIQISPEAAAFAREQLGLTHIETRDLLEVGYPAESFDAVSVYHVLEHLADPHAFLCEVQRILRPGGLLVLEVPNAAGLGARWAGRYWLGWDLPYHRFHFTRETLERATQGAGFGGGKWSYPWLEYGPAVVIQSLLNLLTRTENRLFRTLTYTGVKVTRLSGIQLGGHLIGAVLLAIPGILLAMGGGLLGAGEVIAVRCRKVGLPSFDGPKAERPAS